uniref:Ribosomal protein S2 n=1 Tax=Pseudo-nitzschia multiseries TaxID=37319 RepID=A0A0G3F820_PSEMU|nr:ribosomal protein S2 [Pseudo-nitzschia multiseries]AKJ77353.1 ribosomal protein S2 [Pseudo-nitzschia multiseries]
MKIRKVKIKQLLKLNLLKSKVYEQPIKKMKFDNLIDANLNKIVTDIKKVLQIVFHYHKAERRILFVGLPYKLEFKINQSTKHVAVHKSFDIQGIISNNEWKSFNVNKSLSQIWLKESSNFLLPKLTKKLDLIVMFDHDKTKTILSEAQAIRVPVVLFGTDLDSQNRALYNVEGNFKNVLTASDKNIFFAGLNFLFKNLNKNNRSY